MKDNVHFEGIACYLCALDSRAFVRAGAGSRVPAARWAAGQVGGPWSFPRFRGVPTLSPETCSSRYAAGAGGPNCDRKRECT